MTSVIRGYPYLFARCGSHAINRSNEETSMERFFDNRFVFLTMFTLFVIALLWSLGHGGAGPLREHALPQPDSILTAHGSSMPPDPWDGLMLAHGSSMPPDPWDG